jgi:phospholipid/cholesterol/gamma-HCH transport system substrate-binding protein
LAHIEAITGGIERGEGTVGKLLKDDSTIVAINDTIDSVNGLIGDASKIRTEVYYRGNYYFGSDPTSGVLAENPVAGRARNGVGVRLFPNEDHWYVFEMAGHPQGDISSETHVFPDFGSAYEEVVVKPGFRITFEFARRWHDAVLRFGIKDNSGGIGFDYYFADDHLMLGADLFDFTYGSYPVLDGTPNLQLNARWMPWRHLYFEAGLDSVLMGAKYGYVSGYAGGGFYFDDRDVKLILAALPLKP